ncbi:adenylate/guanylate cyclase domain-containing protein [Labrenzia suaedae]|uniref:Adenylate/guanylate cyclase domain-containing protein n=2 Tax=Roseibium litorale TaxID=2803841 RepID=A0ABR9CPX0_9HYPH|nr:adenylate/guanylate cyclase domain-containing protein [Roseibium litorale]
MMIVICGVIIGYMSTSDRRIAGRLLDDGATATLKVNRAVLDRFFAVQETALQAAALDLKRNLSVAANAISNRYGSLFPQGTRLSVREAGSPAVPVSPALTGIRFVRDAAAEDTMLELAYGFERGKELVSLYPLRIVDGLLGQMKWEGRQQPFLLEGRDKVISISGWKRPVSQAGPASPLPSLSDLGDHPLRAIWQENADAHTMGGNVTGRVFPSSGGMYTAILADITDGPAAGWTLGTLYQAKDFGAALDQSRIVLYAAVIALCIGAFLSFLLGRLLGRPLTRLAEASARVRGLDFDGIAQLPPSRLTELDNVNAAFNGTVSALNAFARYVPRQLVKRLIEQGMTDPRQIETREMTVVFTDIAGFTTMASRLSAEETAGFLTGYFELVSDAISAEDGTIDKYIGDGVMAFWGAPVDQPNHRELAVAFVRKLAERLDEEADKRIRVRVGIHTGQVVVGNIGSISRVNYTVIGDVVNVAARLQEYGKSVDPDARLIALASEETMAGVERGEGENLVGRISLRGREQETSVFRIV